MSDEDFEFAVRLTNQMQWDFSEADFRFMTELEPEGCFVLLLEAERIGIATTVSYGHIGWFGNLIVAPDRRRGGGGTCLVKHALKYLAAKGVTTVGLYAYRERIPFYAALGFTYDSNFIVLKSVAPSASRSSPSVREAEKHEVEQIINFDHRCFGSSRRKLLEPLLRNPGNRCYVYVDDLDVLGFALAKVYDESAELGPVVCVPGRSDVATELLAAALARLRGLEFATCIPEKKAELLDFLAKLGFTKRFEVTRMFSGPPIVCDCVWATESLERG